MNREKSTDEGACIGKKVDDLSRADKGPIRSHVWRYRWLYFLIFYLPLAIPVFYVSITDTDDPFLTGSFFSDSLKILWSIAITSMGFLWMFSLFYLMIGVMQGKKWRWLVAIFLCPPFVLSIF